MPTRCVDGLSPRMGRVTNDVCGPQGLHRDSEPIHKGAGFASPRSSGLFPFNGFPFGSVCEPENLKGVRHEVARPFFRDQGSGNCPLPLGLTEIKLCSFPEILLDFLVDHDYDATRRFFDLSVHHFKKKG